MDAPEQAGSAARGRPDPVMFQAGKKLEGVSTMRMTNAALLQIASLRHQGLTVSEIAREMATRKERIEQALIRMEDLKKRLARTCAHQDPNSGRAESAAEISTSMLFLARHDPR
jgi:IS30 family transposase